MHSFLQGVVGLITAVGTAGIWFFTTKYKRWAALLSTARFFEQSFVILLEP
jgi:membrane-associated phospholipid phosphatase